MAEFFSAADVMGAAVEMLQLIPSSEHSHILECIAEERRHLRQLLGLLKP